MMFGDGRLPARFWSKAAEDASGCWIWVASNTGGRGRYGVFWWRGRLHVAHRVAYMALVGEIPDGLVLDHLCEIKQCVNPEHLKPTTNRENVKRGRLGQATHCPQNHPYDGPNLAFTTDGRRVCKARRNESRRQWGQKQKLQRHQNQSP